MPRFTTPMALLTALVSMASPSIAQDRVTHDIVFAHVDGHPLALDLYLPATAPKGILVWVHGGAWRSGSKDSVDLKGMTAHGWAVASVDYRLSNVAKFPAAVHDIKAAIRYLRARAAELGLPDGPMVVGGSSAGGHLAAEVGVTNGHAALEGTVGNHLDQSSAVDAIVDLYGASDFTTILQQSTPYGLDVRRPALDLFIGGQPEDVPDLAKLASPIFHVDANDPPLYLSHGDRDPQMPINQAHQIYGAYQALGLPVVFEVMHGSAHGGPDFTSPATMARIDAFLTAQLKLP